jgi:hypothetical protein
MSIGGAFNSESSSETSTTTQNAGFSEVSGFASSVNLSTGKKSKYTTVNLLDGGAIGKAFDFGAAALKQIELAGENNKLTSSGAITAVKESARSEGENIAITVAKWAAIAAMVYFGFRALRG